MTNDKAEIIGKLVKDIYGSYMGKVVGTITEIDGSVQSVGVDCGTRGLQMIPHEHLVIQEDVVIFVPKWRLDSQRLIREKQLTLRRLRALVEIVAGKDDVHMDAEIIQEKYHSKLVSLQDLVKELKSTLAARLADLDDQLRSTKMLFFDAKIQYKSDEISEESFETVRLSTSDLIEHMSHETKEIKNIETRLQGLEDEVQVVNDMMGVEPADAPAKPYLKESLVSSSTAGAHTILHEAPGSLPTAPVAGAKTKEPLTTTTPEKTAAVANPAAGYRQEPDLMQGKESEDLKQAAETSDADSSGLTTTTNAAPASRDVDTNVAAAAMPTAPKMDKAEETAPKAAAKNASDTAQPEDMSDLPPAKVEADRVVMPSPPGPYGSMPNMAQHYAPSFLQQDLGAPPVTTTPSPGNVVDHVQQHEGQVVFPEPPKNLAPQKSSTSSSSNDDDWLSRMESQ